MQASQKSKIRSFLNSQHGKFNVDVLVEVLAGIMLDSEGFREGQLHILPKFRFKRNYTNDITDFELDDNFDSGTEDDTDISQLLVKLFTSRNSLLDNLPEAFYIDPYELEKIEDARDREKYRENKQKNAIRFFSPLELAYNRLRVRSEIKESELLSRYDELLLALWGEGMPATPAWNRFLRTLHLVSYVMGNREKTSMLIRFVLNKPIEISESIEEKIELPEDQKRGLGELGLGYDFNMGNVIPVYVRKLTITIQDLDEKEFSQYFDKSSEFGKLLEEIGKYYFPLDVDVDFALEIKPGLSDFSFGLEGSSAAHAILGYSTKI